MNSTLREDIAKVVDQEVNTAPGRNAPPEEVADEILRIVRERVLSNDVNEYIAIMTFGSRDRITAKQYARAVITDILRRSGIGTS